MSQPPLIRLGVNVDHVATVRQARGVDYPDPVEAALAAERGGAGGITVHLREDRRHIQEHDVRRLMKLVTTKVNLEVAATPAMTDLACEIGPHDVCIVPERREELTTEGGLAVAGRESTLRPMIERMRAAGITVSLFIEPDAREIDAAGEVGATVVELHTGAYANATAPASVARHLEALQSAAAHAHRRGLQVNGGHGLTLGNVVPIAAIPQMVELNIGHSIVARAIMVGIERATAEMLETCVRARQQQAPAPPPRPQERA
ncbi:MAG TPA: pyridoxine 5'-phosphate synthase [Candidatus Limnocylindrales bacterium]|nr:pyridoxine 5'-phosphate synthase [Candidatus Limnocylindrales bacterium]